jgi:hypothetical protein
VGGGSAEAPAGVDEPGGVVPVGVGVLADGGVGEPAGVVAGDLGRFGGVFGQVPGDFGVGNLVVAGEFDGGDVDLFAPADDPAFPAGRGGPGW